MKQDFLNYISETFQFSPQELQDFESSLSVPLKKTIRVNTNKISIEDFKTRATKNNWTLTETSLGKNMFYIDRTDDLDIALGNTLEHLNGYFYVQELAASSSPFYMSGDMKDTGEYTILDMSASPGGKTTQLSEYYPNSLIFANELDKTRLKGLFSNIDRMGGENICVTNYDGRFFKNIPEMFDKVLLDAPCSGEGTAFKTDDALKFWNIKNIKRIAKLQFGLLESAGKTVKVGGEIVYSTCTLNTMENEEIIEKFLKKYEGSFEVISLVLPPDKGGLRGVTRTQTPLQEGKEMLPSLGEGLGESCIRNWPHKNKTGGFFVAKLRKTQSLLGSTRQSSEPTSLMIQDMDSSLPPQGYKSKEIKTVRQNYEKLSSNDIKVVQKFYSDIFGVDISGKYLSTYRGEVYLSNRNTHNFWEKLFFYQIGKKIGTFENGEFTPNFYGNTSLLPKKGIIKLSKTDIHTLYTGYDLNTNEADGYYEVFSESISGGMVKIKEQKMKSLLDTGKMRK